METFKGKSSRALTASMKKFMKEFNDLFNKNYDEFYEADKNNEIDYDQAVETFDALVKKPLWKQFIGLCAVSRGDIYSSDREAAAFVKTVDEFFGSRGLKESAKKLSEDYDNDDFDELDGWFEVKAHKALKEIKPEDLESDVKWLWDNKCGCVHYPLFGDDDITKEYDFCIGWTQYFDEDETNIYKDGEFAIAARFGSQSYNNAMQTDLDIDFQYPTNEGELFDNTVVIHKDEDFAKLLADFDNQIDAFVGFTEVDNNDESNKDFYDGDYLDDPSYYLSDGEDW